MGRLGTLWQVGRTFGIRGGLLRLEYEAQRSSGLMARSMRSVEGWDSWSWERIAPRISPDDFLDARRSGAHPFFFLNARGLSVQLKGALGMDAQAAAHAEGNEILAGFLPFFGRSSIDCGFPPKWFRNAVSGREVAAGRNWTEMRFASEDYGDLKFILEPSRFLFVYRLARSYALSGDERFAEGFWTAVESWRASSPPMSGPLWICGQESSLRIMAWSFGLFAFLGSPATAPRRTSLLMSMIAAHAWRTLQTVNYAQSQRSNHLVSEAVGLWTAGTLYPELIGAADWQKRGERLLREAVIDQITEDGAYLQDSFNYQRMILQQLLWTLRLAEIHRRELAPEIHARTEAAFSFISDFVDAPSGRVPNHGSNDGSYILPLTTCEYGDFRPLLRMGQEVLKKPVDQAQGPWDEAAVWLGGTTPAAGKNPEVAAARCARSHAGYLRIGNVNSWALVRAGKYTRRPFQADQLHVDLWWHGINVARDAGTYLYNGDPPWNNGLATTAVHNTVTVDNRDQMRRAGRFLWLDWAQAKGKTFSDDGGCHFNRFEGEHDGYRRLGVNHRRVVRCLTEDAWLVIDDITGHADHEVRVHWLLPDLPFTAGDAGVILDSESGRLRWGMNSVKAGDFSIIRGGKPLTGDIEGHEMFGWESLTYGELSPAISLLYRMRAALPVRIVTTFLAHEALALRDGGGKLAVLRDSKQLFEVSLAPGAADV